MTISTFLSVQQSDGLWLDLNDLVNYRVASSSFDTYAQSWRRIMVNSPYMEGSYQVHAVPENVNETVDIYVYGATFADANANLELLLEAFRQSTYKVARAIEGADQAWTCLTADYSVKTTNVFANSKMILVSFSIPRLPTYETTISPSVQDLDGGFPDSTYQAEAIAGGV